jgi:hypothetical protein
MGLISYTLVRKKPTLYLMEAHIYSKPMTRIHNKW